MALYGHEIDEEHNPFEAGLAFAIALTPEKGDFVGRAGLERMAGARTQRLVGITTSGKRRPRPGYAPYQGEEPGGGAGPGADEGQAGDAAGHREAGGRPYPRARGGVGAAGHRA